MLNETMRRYIMSEELSRRELERMYAWVSHFVNKIACVRDHKGKYFHIKPDGAPLYGVGRGYSLVGHFHGNLALARIGNREFHIRRDGRPAYNEYYALVGPFSEGYALAKDHTGWFHIHPNGLPAYKQRYDETRTFSEGFAVARIGMHFVYIKPDGTQFTKHQFDIAAPFQNGSAYVVKNGDDFLFDENGQLNK